jgi:hypothetical protein
MNNILTPQNMHPTESQVGLYRLHADRSYLYQ